jgi:hypothetical protein
VAIPPPPPPPEVDRPESATPAEEERARRRDFGDEGPGLPEPLEEEETFVQEPVAEPAESSGAPVRKRPRPQASRPRPVPGDRSYTALMVIVGIAAVGTLAYSIVVTRLGTIDYSNFVFMLVIFILASLFELKLKGGGKINLGIAPLIAALIALPVKLPSSTPYSNLTGAGAVQVVWMFLLGSIVVLVIRLAFGQEMHSKLNKDDFLAMLLEYAGVGLVALVFYLIIKILPKKPILHGGYTPVVLVAAAVSAALLYVLYIASESYTLSAEGQFPMGVYFQSVARKSWLPFSMLAFSGAAMGLIFVGIGMWSMIIVLPFLLIFMYAFNRVAATDQYLLETIRVLSAIPEETGMLPLGHADRVSELAVGVARELGLSPEDTQQVEYAAYLHDIGAITRQGIHGPDQRQLTEVEGVIAGGVDIVGKVSYLDVAAEILGGREGLRDRVADVEKRRAVSIGAGILRAVDDFETLVQGNDVREPVSENDALTEMNLERGVKYDSKVLRAIARVVARLPREKLSSAEGSPESSPFWGDQEG